MKQICQIGSIILVIFSSSAIAQVRIGVLSGLNSTGFSGDNPSDGNFAADIGYNVGTAADVYIIEDIILNLQPMYCHRASIIQFDVKYQYEKYDSVTINSDYFELPLNIKILADNKFSYVTAGLSIAIPLNSIAINNRSGNEQDIKERFESYVLSANFAVGIQFEIGKPEMFIELCYTQSLTNLADIKINDIAINNKLKSNSIQLYTGILFTI